MLATPAPQIVLSHLAGHEENMEMTATVAKSIRATRRSNSVHCDNLQKLLGNTVDLPVLCKVARLALTESSFSHLAHNRWQKERLALPRRRRTRLYAERADEIEDTRNVLRSKTLQDFRVVGTLGTGGFGRVDLVHLRGNQQRSFALKRLKKQHVVETAQQRHVFNEKSVMMEMSSCPFTVALYTTFRDSRYLYLVEESCLGGEVWAILRDEDTFDARATRFVLACVLEALDYMHSHGIVFRDLKPENLLMDSRGYIKVVDFGFAKKIGLGQKTWTFCGTPDYVAPEVILGKGHDFSVDYWSLGILAFELLTGSPPFFHKDPLTIYGRILKGIGSVKFPRTFPQNAKQLVRRLCQFSPKERLGTSRLGADDVRTHRWFYNFDWDALSRQAMVAPLQPVVHGPTDLGNFDYYPPEQGPPPSEDLTGWDDGF